MLSPALRILLFAVPFSVRRMFFMGEPGLHLEAITPEQNAVNPTMFQDSAGTTPITAIEQPVGLWLDTKLGAVRGAELRGTGAIGLLGSATAATYDTATGAGSVTRVDGSNQSYVGFTGLSTSKFYEIVLTNTGASSIFIRPTGFGTGLVTISAGQSGRGVVTGYANYYITGNTGTQSFTGASIREIPGNHVSQSSAGARPTYTRRVNLLNATATLSTQNVTTVAASYKLSFTGTGTVTLSGTSTAGPLVGTGANDRVSLTFTATAGTLTLTVSGSVTLADLRPSNIAALNIPAYQRVTSSTDYDTEGFPPMVKGNGTSQWMSGTLDMSSTDKVLVVAGVTKYSDAAQAIICELTASAAANNGGFALCAPAAGSATYSGLSRGSATATATTGTTHASPKPAVVTMQANVAADVLTLNVNGVDDGTSATDQGSGNYASSTLYLFSRGGSSLWSSAGVTSLTVRGGDGSTWASRLRNYVKDKMRLVY